MELEFTHSFSAVDLSFAACNRVLRVEAGLVIGGLCGPCGGTVTGYFDPLAQHPWEGPLDPNQSQLCRCFPAGTTSLPGYKGRATPTDPLTQATFSGFTVNNFSAQIVFGLWSSPTLVEVDFEGYDTFVNGTPHVRAYLGSRPFSMSRWPDVEAYFAAPLNIPPGVPPTVPQVDCKTTWILRRCVHIKRDIFGQIDHFYPYSNPIEDGSACFPNDLILRVG